ncbi:hypothetical protein HELRODRAFT_177489 [Helobdella robusta]|uniref:Uncharacterized protein n=1 Tax=Helobdella robusta TaxID=6412 RepID=T1FBS2_HELRO|nr:hypothetical protein HELRODRAFT_177489 [Helobdella robusta]ESN97853.1 hypothetical protein HELRODRAFT_177489 [Helobdella robusta]
MSDAVTDCMSEHHTTMTTLGTTVIGCQQQVMKLNNIKTLETMTKALWTIEQEKKKEIISKLELQSGSSFLETNLTVKQQIVKTRRFGHPKICVTLDNSTTAEDADWPGLSQGRRCVLSKRTTTNLVMRNIVRSSSFYCGLTKLLLVLVKNVLKLNKVDAGAVEALFVLIVNKNGCFNKRVFLKEKLSLRENSIGGYINNAKADTQRQRHREKIRKKEERELRRGQKKFQAEKEISQKYFVCVLQAN